MKIENKKSLSKNNKLLLIFGFLFFVNPVPLGLDFIPDVFGCVLIYFGLTQLAYFDGAAEKARKGFLYLAIVEAVRLLSMEMIVTTEIGSNRMLAVTAFAIVEGMLYISIFRAFFGGISYYSMRNNCNKTLAKTDGCAFLTYLAFFTRVAATFIPELMAIIELELEVAVDFDVMESINEIIAVKPVLVLLLSLIALITSIAWFVSIKSLITLFQSEAGEELDRKYISEYSSRPELVRPKRLARASLVLYIALFFALDIIFDGINVVPAAVMYLGLFVAYFFLKEFMEFKRMRTFAIPAFLLFAVSEGFKAVYVPYGAVAIYETDMWIVITNAVIAFFAVLFGMLCVRSFLKDLERLSLVLGGSAISSKNAWISYCFSVIFWTAGYVVPYFYASFSALRFFAAAIFIWQTAKLIGFINAEEQERASLYGTEDNTHI